MSLLFNLSLWMILFLCCPIQNDSWYVFPSWSSQVRKVTHNQDCPSEDLSACLHQQIRLTLGEGASSWIGGDGRGGVLLLNQPLAVQWGQHWHQDSLPKMPSTQPENIWFWLGRLNTASWYFLVSVLSIPVASENNLQFIWGFFTYALKYMWHLMGKPLNQDFGPCGGAAFGTTAELHAPTALL